MIACYKNAPYSLVVQSLKPTLKSCRAIDVRGNLGRKAQALATEKYGKWLWVLILCMSSAIAMIMDEAQVHLAETQILDNFIQGVC